MTTEQAPDRVERVTRLVAATPQQIFDLLADPSKHASFDGSGSVQAPVDAAAERLTLGSKFAMKMRIGVPYRITNEVVEFDEPRLIAWRHFGGHIWRYRLEPAEGGTLVTEEFDWRASRSAPLIKAMRYAPRNRAAMEATLDRLVARFAST